MGTRTVERKEAGTGRALNSSDGCRIGVVGATVAWLFVLEKLLSCGSVWSISPSRVLQGRISGFPCFLLRCQHHLQGFGALEMRKCQGWAAFSSWTLRSPRPSCPLHPRCPGPLHSLLFHR